MSWSTGKETINDMLAAKELERVQPNLEGAQAFLDADLVRADHKLASRMLKAAVMLTPELPVFTG